MKSTKYWMLKYLLFLFLLIGVTAFSLLFLNHLLTDRLGSILQATPGADMRLDAFVVAVLWRMGVFLFFMMVLFFNFFEMFTFGPLRRFHKTVSSFSREDTDSLAVTDKIQKLSESIGITDTNFGVSGKEMMTSLLIDPLTKIPNREAFRSRILSQAALYSRSKERTIMGILLIDVNAFKEVNDTYGTVVGDQVLIALAQRIQESLRNTDLVFRISGNEFGAILSYLPRELDAVVAVEKLLAQLHQPLVIGGRVLYLSASIGISTYPLHGSTDHELIHAAELALHEAKKKRGCFRFFSKPLQREAERRMVMKSELHSAIREKGFRLYFQPQNRIDGSISGCEVLVRWKSKTLGVVSPEEFIPLLEESGLIISLGEWILKSAIKEWITWSDRLSVNLSISINVSPKQLANEALIHHCTRLMEQYHLDPRWIHIELTESGILENQHSQTILRGLADSGFQIDLDDFGVGYSSLSRLQDLPISTLKIDKSFIRDLSSNSFNKTMVKNIINLAHDMDLTVVAEGVEDQQQLDELAQLNCDTIQGYFFSQPLLAEDFIQYAEQHRRP